MGFKQKVLLWIEIEIIPQNIEKGEDLSKLIINNYILNNKDLSEEEKIKFALKYQIFTKDTSLFAEVELSNKITEEMKLRIIGDKENNIIKQIRKYDYEHEDKDCCYASCCYNDECDDEANISYDCEYGCCDDEGDEGDDDICYMKIGNDVFKEQAESKPKIDNFNLKEEKEELNQQKIENQGELNNKENIMKMINTQDFIDGYWEINEYTKMVIEKYQKEFNLLKGLKDKNINDKIALTILVIYFIYKEHSELLADLIMIIKKGKIFIQKETKDNYENIIKEIGLN